ncbi:hypothetical protein EON67_05625, partial [archaeon]
MKREAGVDIPALCTVLLVCVRHAASHPATQHLSVAIIEPRAPETLDAVAAKTDVDLRVFAITPSSARTLQAAGVWDCMLRTRAGAFEHMQVWDAVGTGGVRFDADNAGQPIGWILENRVMTSALWDALTCRVNVLGSVNSAVLPPAHDVTAVGDIASSVPAGAPARLALSDGTTLNARLVVAADGAQSR